MIYFNEALQSRVLSEIMDKMHDNALLIMGKQEDIPPSMKSRFKTQGSFYCKKAR